MAYEGSEEGRYGPNGGGHGRRIYEKGRKARGDAMELAHSVEGVLNEARVALEEQLESRPYVTLGIAAGVGYVLGAGIPRFGGVALAIGGRMLASMMLKKVMEEAGASGKKE